MIILVVYILSLFNIYCSTENKLINKKNIQNSVLINNSYDISDLINNNATIIDKNSSKRKLQANEFEPIRIYVDTSYLMQQDIETSQIADPEDKINISLVLESITEAKEAIQKIIKVKRKQNNRISLDDKSHNFNGFIINKMNQTVINYGITNYDLLIFVRFSSEGQDDKMYLNSNIFAYPGVIKQNNDENDKRPIIGYIIYNRNYQVKIKSLNNIFQKEIIRTIFLHEYIHILGFMNSIFDSFNNKDEIFDTIYTNRTGTLINKKIVKSTKILNLAKKYFNCYDDNIIKGIELESQQNFEDLPISHWEGRILLGDIMTSDLYFQEQIISEFTLALLEESGWYQANYYTGGLMNFGKHKGCAFLNTDCIRAEIVEYGGEELLYYNIAFPNEFCHMQNSQGTCSIGRISKGYCENAITKSPSETLYTRENFKNYGKMNAEYCPVSNDISQRDSSGMGIQTYYYDGNCKLGNNQYGVELSYKDKKKHDYSVFSESFGEKTGDHSFCVLSSVLNKNEEDNKLDIYGGMIRPTCYPMYCSEKSLTIQINLLFVVCPQEGNYIKIGGDYMGYILCPDYNSICSGTEICNNLFDCIEKNSTIKNMNYSYEYTIGKVINNINSGGQAESKYEKELVIGYEYADDGQCPRDCIQCLKNRRCILCRDFEGNHHII